MQTSLFSSDYTVETSYNPEARIIVFHGDVIDFVRQIPNNSVHLIVTSPPYNLGKEYEERLELGVYLEKQSEVITELHRILRDDGSICWQVGNFIDKGEVYPLDILYYSIFRVNSL
jgi:adenine-specific DNA-methyltransferase